ncbi:MAG: LacI family DNA-binding transcriptional regulator [Jatrophihabitans sp.]
MASGVRARPTLAAVADLVGVSRTTVSNAYNRPDQLSVELRERILAAAVELGYMGPDPMARSLRTRTASALGLVFADKLAAAFGDPAAVEFLQGVGKACEDSGRSLLLVPAGAPGTKTETVERAAVDGFVAYSMPRDDPHITSVVGRGQPVVVVDSPREATGLDFVGIDDRAAFHAVAAHLIALGHRQIGLIAARCGVSAECGSVSLEELMTDVSSVARERALGLRDALVAGVQVGAWVCAAHSPANGLEGARTLLADDPAPTALLCMSDALALGALQAARERGLSVPADLSVTGFDDVPTAAAANLTTVHQPTREKGSRAVALLDEPATDGARVVILPTELVVRGSSGPAAR